MNLARKNVQYRRKDIRLTMLYKMIMWNSKFSKKEILISADTRTTSKQGHKYLIMTKNTDEYKYSFFQ